MKKYIAEAIGTFWLVIGGCGSAVLSATYPELGIGFFGVALAFGLSVVTMAYAIGHISGCHLNPAVSIGLWVGGRFDGNHVLGYIIAQLLGAVIAGGILYIIATGQSNFSIDPNVAGTFATNGYAELSPNGYSMFSAFIIEIVMTMMFLFIIMGATDKEAPAFMAPLAIGLTLTLIHLISIPVTNTSVNPARSFGVAVYVGGEALSQLWLFVVAPIIGAISGAKVYKYLK